MNIKKTCTVEFSEDKIKEILIDYLAAEGYLAKVQDITFDIGSRLEGFGMAEHPVEYFKCARIELSY